MADLLSFYKPDVIEAGCDEAGRGCLAGPVFAAAIILPIDFYHPWLNDSKQVSEKRRNILRPILETEAVCFAVGVCTSQEIDEINILNASILAMHRALAQLNPVPAHIIIDGNRFKNFNNIPYQTVVKGDSKYLSIAAASVLAKTYRDEYMEKLHISFPGYKWNKNKGYPTVEHRKEIEISGITAHHRTSFTLIDKQLKFDFGIE